MYTLRFPFRLPPGREINIIDDSTSINDLNVSLTKEGKYYVIYVSGFQTEDDAKKYEDNILAGLKWLLLENEFYSIIENLDFDKVTYSLDPIKSAEILFRNWGIPVTKPVDGIVNENFPSVYPTEKNIRFCGVGTPTVVVSTPSKKLFKAIDEVTSLSRIDSLIKRPKLMTALDLYGAYYIEETNNARLITLVNAIEALSEKIGRPEPIKKLVGQWKQEIKDKKEQYDKNTAEFNSLASLEGNLRETESIARQTTALIENTLSNDKDVSDVVKKWSEIYGIRSELLHEGYVKENSKKLSEAIQEAKIIVHRVLRAYFIKVVNEKI